MNSDNENVIWVKIKKDLTNLDREIYLGTLYHTPSGKKEDIRTKYIKLAEDISSFQQNSYVILQGDFNAHTNTCNDFIEYDEIIEDLESDFNITVPPRKSEDNNKVDLRVQELIQLCRSLNLNILNGRKTGDIFGKITSFQ